MIFYNYNSVTIIVSSLALIRQLFEELGFCQIT